MSRTRQGFIPTFKNRGRSATALLLALLLAASVGLTACGGSGSGGAEGSATPPQASADTPDASNAALGGSDPAPEVSANPFEDNSFVKSSTRNEAFVALFPPPAGANVVEDFDEAGDYEWYIDGTFVETHAYVLGILTKANVPDMTPSFLNEMTNMGGLTAESMGLTPSPGATLTGDDWWFYGVYNGVYFSVQVRDAAGFDDNYDYHERTLVAVMYGD